MSICRVCSKEFESEAALHKHIKAHKLLLAEYFQSYYPRYDKHSGEMIHWTNLEQYLKSDFNSRENLKLWLEKTELSIARNYCKEMLVQRKQTKNLIWSPTQVELRASMSPPVQWFNAAFEDYYCLCDEIGFKNRFEKFEKWEPSIKLDKRMKIFTDSREQQPYSFSSVKTEVKGLKYADYVFSNAEWSGKIAVERKSLNDFIGTISKGYERFGREIEKSIKDEAYLIIIVEETLSNAISFKSLPYLSKKIQASPEFIFHRVRELLQKYQNIQFLFAPGHKAAGEIVERLFSLGAQIKKFDLQLLFDVKKL